MSPTVLSRNISLIDSFNILGIVLLVSVLLASTLSIHSSTDPYRCHALMNEGQWLDSPSSNGSQAPFKEWQPRGCMAHQYNAADIAHCLGERKVIFAGDSTVRQVYWSVARKLNFTHAVALEKQAKKHSDQYFASHDVRLEFIWDPFLSSSRLQRELSTYSDVTFGHGNDKTTPAMILIGSGAWFARWYNSSHSLSHFQLAIENVTAYMEEHKSRHSSVTVRGARGIGDRLFWSPIPTPIYDQLKGRRKASILEGEIEQMNDFLRTFEHSNNVLWSYSAMTKNQTDAVELAGLHTVDSVADAKADVLLNLRCNAVTNQTQGYPFDQTCCTNYARMNWEQQLILAISGAVVVLMLFYLISRNVPNTTLCAFFFFTAALAYCYAADRTQILAKANKHFMLSEFSLLCGIAFLAGLLTFRRSGKPSNIGTYNDQPFLSRDQTEEWKGWMQFVILIYHWTGASSTLPIYQFIRLLVASYLFLTGFGHTCYFLRKNDFSLKRVANVLLRLNMLSCALPYVMGTNYMFYYFAPLVTFWFGVVWVTMRVYASRNESTAFVLGKIVLAAMIGTLLLRSTTFEILFTALKPHFNIEWDVHEWKFRLGLDRYVVFVGMLVAVAFERYSKAVDSDTLTLTLRLIRISAIILSIIAVLALPKLYAQFNSKSESNAFHGLLSPVPILAFITLRNATRALRNYHSTFFAWLGTFSLETFVLQYHIWLAADTKGLLSLGFFQGDGTLLGDRWRDFVVLTPVFFWLSLKVANATSKITDTILQEDEDEYDLGIALVPEKVREPSFLSNLAGWIWPRDLKVRMLVVLLGMWTLNLSY